MEIATATGARLSTGALDAGNPDPGPHTTHRRPRANGSGVSRRIAPRFVRASWPPGCRRPVHKFSTCQVHGQAQAGLALPGLISDVVFALQPQRLEQSRFARSPFAVVLCSTSLLMVAALLLETTAPDAYSVTG